MNADSQIKRLLKARDQIDDAIDSLNTKGIANWSGETETGIMLPSKTDSDEDFTMLIYGWENLLVCRDALVWHRKGVD